MNKKNIIIMFSIVAIISIGICTYLLLNTKKIDSNKNLELEDKNTNTNNKTLDKNNTVQYDYGYGTEKSNIVGLTNPASTNCINKGGTLEIKKAGNDGEYGLCHFEDNKACEEWALYKGECPIGGVKTTGFDTEAQRLCAWLGGTTVAEKNATCTFNGGSTCLDDDLYNGKCLPDYLIKQ